MSPEELDEARAKEAEERWRDMHPNDRKHTPVGTIAARLAREGWTPPEPEPEVDPDVFAYREWAFGHLGRFYSSPEDVLAGKWDRSVTAQAYLAGARMAREQERERANHPIAFAVRVMAGVFKDLDHAEREARSTLAKYRGEP